MELCNELIYQIKSKYNLKIIFDFVGRKTTLKIIKVSKSKYLVSNLEIGIHFFLFNVLWNELDKQINYIITYNKDKDSVLNILQNNIEDKERQKIIINEFFTDLAKNYDKNFIILSYYSDMFSTDDLQFLLSLGIPIKLNVKIDTSNFNSILIKDTISDEKNRNTFIDKQKSSLDIFNYYEHIYGIDFLISKYKNIEYVNFTGSLFYNFFLDKINEIINRVKNIRIPYELINELIKNDLWNFFGNIYKKIDIYGNDALELLDFSLNFLAMNNFIRSEQLTINLSNVEKFVDFSLDLSNISGIKRLKLINSEDLISFKLNEETTLTINDLTIINSNVTFDEKNIIFPNLISLEIKEVFLSSIFFNKIIDINSFPNLKKITVEITSIFDYILLNNILKFVPNLIELNISKNLFCKEHSGDNYLFYSFYVKGGKDSSYRDDDMELIKNSNILGNTLLTLTNLKYLSINDFCEDCPFINLLMESYANYNLIEFKSNCIEYSSCAKFLISNKNIKNVSLKN